MQRKEIQIISLDANTSWPGLLVYKAATKIIDSNVFFVGKETKCLNAKLLAMGGDSFRLARFPANAGHKVTKKNIYIPIDFVFVKFKHRFAKNKSKKYKQIKCNVAISILIPKKKTINLSA